MSDDVQKPLVLLATGGTGGHITPAEALAGELTARGYRPVLVTDPKGKFFNRKSDMPVFYVDAAGVADRGFFGKVKAAFSLFKGYLQARRLIKSEKPVAVVGFGGYSCVPTCLAANRANIPLILHEQNAVLGRANRFLASRARILATSFPKVLGVQAKDVKKIILTGNPVRKPILDAGTTSQYKEPGPKTHFNIFVVGGSQGSRRFAQVLPQAIALLPVALQKRLQIVQQVRRETLQPVKEMYEKLGVQAELKEFFENMPRRLSEAHLIICRAGASTVFEVATIGRPAIMVPYPYAIYDHQTVNASIVEDAGGAWLIPQSVLHPETLADMLKKFMDEPGILTEAAAKARGLSRPDAAKRLANVVERVVQEQQTKAA